MSHVKSLHPTSRPYEALEQADVTDIRPRSLVGTFG